MNPLQKIFDQYNQELKSKLIPDANEPIETNFVTDCNDPIFDKSFEEIRKIIEYQEFDLELEQIKNNLNL
jgi:hypothetical protein